MGPKSYAFTLNQCKNFGSAYLYHFIGPGRSCGREKRAIDTSASFRCCICCANFFDGSQKICDSVFAYKLNGTAMIFPFGVQFHADQRLFVWRPRGALNEGVVIDVVAALGQLEAQFSEPFNRFTDSAGVSAVDI